MSHHQNGITTLSTRNEAPSTGGIPCGKCSNPIAVSINDLLTRRVFYCKQPGCGGVMRLNTRNSEGALSALKAVKTKIG